MATARFHDALPADRAEISELIESGRTPVIQFSRPPSPSILEQTDDFCREFGESVEIRFFNFAWQVFDASLLERLPHVANLSIDSIRAISDFTPIANLPHLTQLRFGVYEHPDGHFLRQLDLSRLTRLTLAQTKRRNFDLSPLNTASSLTQLFVQGHWRGIEAIRELPRLSDVSLSGFPKHHDISFLNGLAALRSLLLILGSRTSIAEFTHDALRELRIVWVRQLEDLGTLARFGDLEELTIEDQLRLTILDLSRCNLRRLVISNCKNLQAIVGLEDQGDLDVLSVHGTKIKRGLG